MKFACQSTTDKFDDIRPYNDSEVRQTLARILEDKELATSILRLKYPTLGKYFGWALSGFIKKRLSAEVAQVNSVHDFQNVVGKYLQRMLDEKSNGLVIKGLDKLDSNKAYLFVSNHRDIAMDPAFINWGLFTNNHNTMRIAIGDNLLTKPFVSDLMRLNKSFIVNRAATKPREKLKAAKHLSSYIHHSLTQENANVWIAQREGRAKDGLDATNSAVIGMFGLSKPKTQDYSDYIKELNIVPVSISYEWDPCDAAKANELYALETEGRYEKGEQEDVSSIATGITGNKGVVTVHFGDVLDGHYDSADQVVAEIDRQIWQNFDLQPSNVIAYQRLHGKAPENIELPKACADSNGAFNERLNKIPPEQQKIFLAGYANPIFSKLKLLDDQADD